MPATPLINLTPHPIRVYDVSVPDRINPADHEPILTVEPSTEQPPARLGEIDLGTQYLGLGGVVVATRVTDGTDWVTVRGLVACASDLESAGYVEREGD